MQRIECVKEVFGEFPSDAKKPALYFIACGNRDFVFKSVTDFRKLLDDNGCKYEYLETGEGHIWRNWRIYLTEFAPKLFK